MRIQLSYDDSKTTRILTSLGNQLDLRDGEGARRPATEAEVAEYLANYLECQVCNMEATDASRASTLKPL